MQKNCKTRLSSALKTKIRQLLTKSGRYKYVYQRKMEYCNT